MIFLCLTQKAGAPLLGVALPFLVRAFALLALALVVAQGEVEPGLPVCWRL
tara:strand:- start:13404 stop:13556 length:153 start_codon:yes stop_codon:yes gene_type:complete